MKRYNKVFFSIGLILLISEIIKQLLLTFVVYGTYNLWYFPWQLCSIAMYILLVMPKIKNEALYNGLLVFLMTYSLLGGIMVFFDQSGLQYPILILTIHSYLWHIVLIGIGIYSAIIYLRKRLAFKDFIKASSIYLLCACTAEVINKTLDKYGNINMFYINPDLKMSQIVFKDLVPIIGNDLVIILYIFMTMIGALLIYLLWRIGFRLFMKDSI